MSDFVIALGYPGLLIISILAASLVPLSTEVFVILMRSIGYNDWGLLFTASLGNTLGAVLNYYIGLKGRDFVLSRWARLDPTKFEQAQGWYLRWGAPILFFSWVPIVGDPLTVVAGFFRLKLSTFILWVWPGKTIRYVVLLGILSYFN